MQKFGLIKKFKHLMTFSSVRCGFGIKKELIAISLGLSGFE